MEDARKVQDNLKHETPAFTQEQRIQMSQAVSALMRTRAASTAAPASQNAKKGQLNLHLFNYMTEKRWNTYIDKQVDWDTKLEDAADFLIFIGCRSPKDETLKVMLAILQACHKKLLTPDDAYNEIRKLSTKMAAKRALQLGDKTCDDFPKNVSDFMRCFPNVYSPMEPPVASRIEESRVRDMTRKDLMPCRDTNLRVSGKRHATGRDMIPAFQPAMHPQTDSRDVLLQYLLTGERAPHAGGLPASSSFLPPPCIQQRPPLHDTRLSLPGVGGPMVPTADKGSVGDAPDSMDKIVAMAKEAAKNKKKAKGKKKKGKIKG